MPFPLPLAEALPGGDGLALTLAAAYAAEASPWGVPAYRFDIKAGGARVGTVSLRLGEGERLRLYAGHVGFAVEPAWRGRRLAGRAVRLLLPLAQAHGQDPLWLTCAPGNRASRRTIERLGGVYAGTVALPADYDAYRRGEREKCRYRLDLGAPAPAGS